jgi:hypothetical protein
MPIIISFHHFLQILQSMNEYELEREARIAENKRRFAELDLRTAAAALQQTF